MNFNGRVMNRENHPRNEGTGDLSLVCSGHLKIGTPVATLPGAWRYRVSTGTGPPGVSIL